MMDGQWQMVSGQYTVVSGQNGLRTCPRYGLSGSTIDLKSL